MTRSLVAAVVASIGVHALFAELPEGYFAVEYVEATGAQYVDTGLPARWNRSARGVFSFPELPSGGGRYCILGAEDLIAGEMYYYAQVGLSDLSAEQVQWMAPQPSSQNGGWPFNRPGSEVKFFYGSCLVAERYRCFIYTNLVSDVGYRSNTATGNTQTFAVPEPNFYLFANNRQGVAADFAKVRLYDLKINAVTKDDRAFSGEGTPLAHYQPAYRRSDGVYGLYDSVGDVFVASQTDVPLTGEALIDIADLDAGGYDMSLTGVSTGVSRPQVGMRVAISRKAGAVRRYGLRVNGVVHSLEDGGFVYEVTAQNVGQALRIEQFVDQNWYLSPSGDDANDGFSTSTAKRTLQGALSVATNAGDVVHAAAGSYAEGEVADDTPYSGRDNVGSDRTRCAIAAGVTLVGDDGAGSTFIDGTGDHRGVFLCAGSKIVGFTITNCVTTTGFGYAVYGVANGDVVADCVIQDSQGPRYAVTHVAAVIRSRFYRNTATVLGAVGYALNCYNCLVGEGHRGGYCFYQGGNLYNCTVLGSLPIARKQINIRNCLSLAPGRADSAYKIFWYNSYYSCETNTCDIMDDACVKKSADDLAVYGNGAPVIGSNDAVDQADEEMYRSAYPSALDPEPDGVDLDLYKRPRFLNAGLDVGCCEGDWLPVYAARMCGGAANRVTVVSATPKTVLDAEGAVAVHDGGEIVFRPVKEEGLCFTVSTAGDGIVTVKVNGIALAPGVGGVYRVDAGEGDRIVSVAYAGGTTEEPAMVSGLVYCGGCVLIVR